MKNIKEIIEFVNGGKTIHGSTHYTVIYMSGRRKTYYEKDILPMSVVEFLTSENTVSDTVYLTDTFNHCTHRRTKYLPANR